MKHVEKFVGGSFVVELKPEEIFCTDIMIEHRFLWSSYADKLEPKRNIEQLTNPVIFNKSNAIFFVEAHFCLCAHCVMKKIKGIMFWPWMVEECLFGLVRMCEYTQE